MEAPNRLSSSMAYYAKLRDIETGLDTVYQKAIGPKANDQESYGVIGSLMAACKNTAAEGIQKAAIGKIKWDLNARESELQTVWKSDISGEQFSLFSLEIMRLREKVEVVWRAINNPPSQWDSNAEVKISYRKLDSQKLSEAAIQESSSKPAALFTDYLNYVKNKFVIQTSFAIGYDEKYLTHLAHLYTYLDNAPQLNQKQKTEIGNAIKETVGHYLSLEQEIREGQPIAGIAKNLAAAIDLSDRWNRTEEKLQRDAKNDFTVYMDEKYPNSQDPYVLALKRYLLNEKSVML
jgi:hypothetical protein